MTVVDTSTNIASHHSTKGSLPTTPAKEESNQYWSPFQPVLIAISDQYYFAV